MVKIHNHYIRSYYHKGLLKPKSLNFNAREVSIPFKAITYEKNYLHTNLYFLLINYNNHVIYIITHNIMNDSYHFPIFLHSRITIY